jgi:tRNA-specific 2-thiouridylase
MRVLVAMSGGVDSSLAAALLHAEGHSVIGVTLHLWDASGDNKVGRCCAPEDRDDARRTCELLGIPHYVLDERAAFRAQVVDPFVQTNLAGRTPIPCVACNQEVKLKKLWQVAQSFGAQRVATGHYARVRAAADGSVELLRGRDETKDQSYFLFGVGQDVLSHLVFPLGELNKTEARERARDFGLPNWNKPDSQELWTCAASSSARSGVPLRAARSWTPKARSSASTKASAASPSDNVAASESRAKSRATCSRSSRTRARWS